jgi:hypothetical protein
MMDRSLGLAEELLLLALNERKGTVLVSASLALPYGLAGAALVELAGAGLVRVDEKKLIAAEGGSARDVVLDGILEMMRSSKRVRSAEHWVGRIGRSSRKLKETLLDRLVQKGILESEEGRLLWIFTTHHYPEADSRPELEIRERVRSAVLGGALPDERTSALIALVHACDLVGEIFPKEERREAKKRAKQIAESQAIGSAVAAAVDAVKTAVVLAATAASS